ncbi:MAG TPA: hypothetical protein VMX17_04325 [Candidatus Glassbacteria bacterium]|nr:hypothetical protein [Candidatus Glassbacteria bacterium]
METKKIPTAKEFFDNKSKELNSDPEDMPEWMIEASIEFAKMHITRALSEVRTESIAQMIVNHAKIELGEIK